MRSLQNLMTITWLGSRLPPPGFLKATPVFAKARGSNVRASTVTFDQTAKATIGRYATTELTADVEIKTIRFEAFIDDLADTAANTVVFKNPFSLQTVKQTKPLRAGTIGLSMRAAFQSAG